jgi:hypothetical protein
VGLSSEAATAAIRAGDPEGAALVLEIGRGVLFRQRLDQRSDRTDLEAVSPDLARRFDEICELLDLPVTDRSPPGVIALHRQAGEEFDRLMHEARQLPGFEDFMRPPAVDLLHEAAIDGPLVYLISSTFGCDALIVTREYIRPLELADIELSRVLELFAVFSVNMTISQDTRLDATMRSDAERAMTADLEWLWKHVCKPILDVLGYVRTPGPEDEWPRVWWVPVGMFAWLPLHAAGEPTGAAGQSVDAQVISSYTPTALALLHARNAPPAARVQLTVVAMPRTNGFPDLPNADAEAQYLKEMFGSACTLLHPDARPPTRSAVVEALGTSTWVHFVCHGQSGAADPAESALMLFDGPLTAAALARLRLAGELAFFSACSTAESKGYMADEALHLAAAAQLAGFRRVVGTLWPIYDDEASRIVESFYRALQSDPSRSASALHSAVRASARRNPIRPSRWVPFVHIGP